MKIIVNNLIEHVNKNPAGTMNFEQFRLFLDQNAALRVTLKEAVKP